MINTKIFVPLQRNEQNHLGGETVYAEQISDGVWRIDSVPLFADLHCNDLVRCDEGSDDHLPRMLEVIQQSALQTVHLLFTGKGIQHRDDIVQEIGDAGFRIEHVEGRLYALNVENIDDLGGMLARFPEELRWWQEKD